MDEISDGIAVIDDNQRLLFFVGSEYFADNGEGVIASEHIKNPSNAVIDLTIFGVLFDQLFIAHFERCMEIERCYVVLLIAKNIIAIHRTAAGIDDFRNRRFVKIVQYFSGNMDRIVDVSGEISDGSQLRCGLEVVKNQTYVLIFIGSQ